MKKMKYVHLNATDFIGDSYNGLAAVLNTAPDQRNETHVNCALLQDCGKYRFGDYAWFLSSNTKAGTLTDAQEMQAQCLYQKFQELHRTSSYRIIGRLYGEDPFFAEWDKRKEYPCYSPAEGSEREWKLDAGDAASISEAEEWLLKNHPDYWMGANIIQECPSGNFSMHAVPGAEYGRWNYENHAARYRFAQKTAMRRGVEAGASEVLTNP